LESSKFFSLLTTPPLPLSWLWSLPPLKSNPIRTVLFVIVTSSRTHSWSELHLYAVELSKFGVAKKDAMDVLVHQLEADLFVEPFADENPALTPANITAAIDPPGLKAFLVFELPARELWNILELGV
jgi:hypothetical protein